MKKIPMRMCLVTHERLPKKELVRIVRTTQQTVEVDLTGKVNGKGAYLKRSQDAILLAQKTKALDKALECTVGDDVYETLLRLVKE